MSLIVILGFMEYKKTVLIIKALKTLALTSVEPVPPLSWTGQFQVISASVEDQFNRKPYPELQDLAVKLLGF